MHKVFSVQAETEKQTVFDVSDNYGRNGIYMKKLITIALVIFLALSLMQFATAEGTEVSYGKDYTLVTPASEGYPDDGIKLTDGIFGTVPDGSTNYYSSGAYVGFNQSAVDDNGSFVVILDLGKVYDSLSGFTVGFLNETSVGIYAPKSVTFEISDTQDGEYSKIGTLDTKKSVEDGVSETHAMTLNANNVSGRFVRISIEHLGEYTDASGATKKAGWTFIDEISVYASDSTSDTESSASSDETSSPETSAESGVSSDMSSELSDVSSESSAPVVPGDDRANTLVFILLAISALTMAAGLFIGKKKNAY